MKYRNKPIIIEAVQFIPDNEVPALEFLGLTGDGLELENDIAKFKLYQPGIATLIIKTFGCEIKVDNYDYITKGVNGEFYPCKPDIFEKLYEKVI